MMADRLRLDYLTVDVFTQEPFTGNPLAIVKVPQSTSLTQDQKQLIAREFNYSETVILHEADVDKANPQWTIDIFLTHAELPFAGHPCVGTACFLGRQLVEASAEVTSSNAANGTLVTKAGPVPFSYVPSNGRASIEVPHNVHIHTPTLTVEDARAVGFPQIVYENMANEPPFVSLVKGVTFALVQLPSEDVLSALAPGFKSWTKYEGLNKDWTPEGSLVAFFFFVKSGRKEDGTTKLRTRMIFGSLEDPATGAASSDLAAYLALNDSADSDNGTTDTIHKFEMVQGVEMGRRSTVGVEVSMHANCIDKLVLIGSAVEVMAGTFAI